MPTSKFIKPEKIWLKNHPDYNEKWVQSIIADDPSILSLGDLILKDKERPLPGAGRIDLLLQDSESIHRYEVEIQLGKTDESHIIRTIEYWDIERKRYPQYDHTAVIIAEDITSRFFNIIGLFNGAIPIIAIQMSAYKFEDNHSLIFTTILEERQLGLEEDDEIQEVTDRAYWENRATKSTVSMADDLLTLINSFAPDVELKYNKFYIGLAKEGQPNNFSFFRPRKKQLNLVVRLKASEEIDSKLEESTLDVLEYDKRNGRYKLKLNKKDVKENEELLKWLFKLAYDNS